MLQDHYTTTMTISRPTVTGNKTTFAAVGDILCHIQPLSPTYQNGQWGRLQKEYRLFTDSEVLIGDKLTDSASKKYEVFGVEHFDFRIGRRHYEALVRGV
jgi:hypothetical protein